MARFIVTSGSHFQPLTYDELVKPLMQMTEAQNKAQDAYDQISMETNALENYISQNPEDKRARAMYDNYKSKLTALQNNLWNNGYSGQTARDLSAARAGYAGDITRLATAIKNRQDRSKEYWDLRHKNPDMVAGDDPGASGLDNYLDDDQYGQNYFNYSGDQFTKEVATDAQARAAELQNTSIAKDPKAVGYLERIDREGYTAQEVSDANNAVEAILMGGADRDAVMANMELPQRILTETLLSHMSATGAQQYSTDEAGNRTGNLSEGEYRRLLEYGKAGLSHAIGKTNVNYMTDQQYAYDKQVAMENLRFQHQMQAADENFKQQKELALIKAGINPGTSGNGNDIDPFGNPSLNDTSTTTIEGNRKRAERQVHKLFGDDVLKFTKSGKEIHNGADASDLVFDYNDRKTAYEHLGFDIGRDPRSSTKKMLTGTVERNGIVYETQLVPIGDDKCVVQKRVAGQYSNREDGWKNDDNMTGFYNRARKKYEDTLDYYKQNEPEIYALASVTPDKMYDLYEKEGFSLSDTPLSRFTERYYAKPENSESTYVQNTIIARYGTDSGKYIQRLSGLLSGTVHSEDGKVMAWKAYNGQSDHIHEYDEKTALPDSKSIIKPGNVFTFDNNGYINNINSFSLDEGGIRNVKFDKNTGRYLGGGYVVISTTKNGKKYTIGLDMFNSDQLNGILIGAKRALDYNDLANPVGSEKHDAYSSAIVSQAVSQIRSAVGYIQNTQSEGGTNKDDNN